MGENPFRSQLDSSLSDHPLEAFRNFSEKEALDDYAEDFGQFINTLATNIIIPVSGDSELEEFGKAVDDVVFGVTIGSEEADIGWYDPVVEEVRHIADVADIDEIDQNMEEFENEMVSEEDLDSIVREATAYEYEESMNVEQAKEWWGMLNIEDYVRRNDETQNIDGGYFRDEVMAVEDNAEAVASSMVGMSVVFAADEFQV